MFCDLLDGESLARIVNDVTYKNPYCYKCWEDHQNSSILVKLRAQKGTLLSRLTANTWCLFSVQINRL